MSTAVSQQRVRCSGGPARTDRTPLEELVRPYGVHDRGITFLDGREDRRYSWHELAGLAGAVGVRLRRLGVRPGDRVATTIGNDVESVLTVLGIWAAGAAVVSVPPASRRATGWYADHFGGLLVACGCRLVVDSEGLAFGDVPTVARATLCADLTPVLDRGDAPLDGTALIQFTSGSVYAPKGVSVNARQLAHHLGAIVDVLGVETARDRFVSWLPLYHDMGLLTMFATALTSRNDLVLMPPTSFATGPSRWLNTLAREAGTVTAAPNFAYRLAATVPYDDGLDLSRVRVSLSGGERLNWQTLVDFHAATERYGLSWGALVPCYGLAESVVGTTATPLGRGPVQGPGGHVSVGRPIGGVQLEAPDGLPAGPVMLGGPWVFDGYHTSTGFTPSPADGWFDTGDHGFTHDGEFYVLGRRNEVIASGGRNVFAEDIESVVHDTEGHAVRACAAFRLAADDQQFGLMVEVPTRPRRTPDEVCSLGAGIRATVSSALGVRVQVLMVRPGTIPRTTSGKVQRAQCRELHSGAELTRRLLTTVA